MTWLKRLLMVLGALWLISIFAGAVILWGNDWRFGAGCLVAGVTLVGSAILTPHREFDLSVRQLPQTSAGYMLRSVSCHLRHFRPQPNATLFDCRFSAGED